MFHVVTLYVMGYCFVSTASELCDSFIKLFATKEIKTFEAPKKVLMNYIMSLHTKDEEWICTA